MIVADTSARVSLATADILDPVLAGADGVLVEAVFWDHRLVSVSEHDRNRPRSE